MKNNNDTNYSPIADDIFYNDLPPLTKEEKCIYSKEECTITTPKWCGENQFTYTKGDDKDCYIKTPEIYDGFYLMLKYCLPLFYLAIVGAIIFELICGKL